MGSKAREVDNRHDGDRRSCRTCSPPDRRRYVSADELWHRLLERGGTVVVPRG